MSLLSIAVVHHAGNMRAIDAYFFSTSASTESGLNTSVLHIISIVFVFRSIELTCSVKVDVKDLKAKPHTFSQQFKGQEKPSSRHRRRVRAMVAAQQGQCAAVEKIILRITTALSMYHVHRG